MKARLVAIRDPNIPERPGFGCAALA